MNTAAAAWSDEPEPPRDEATRSLDPLKLFVRQLNRPLLTRDQERELARRKEAGDENAKWLLVESNLRLVMSVARPYAASGVPWLDLIQEGTLGLIRAVEKFDWRRGYKLSTYATWWIRQNVTRAVGEQERLIRFPTHIVEQVRRLQANRAKARAKLGREPDAAEIAAEGGLDVGQVRRLQQLLDNVGTVSLDAPTGEEPDAAAIGELLEDRTAPEPADAIADGALADEISTALDRLHPRLREVLCRRFGLEGHEEQTLAQVAQDFGLSRERIRQLELQALEALRVYAPDLAVHLG